LFLSLCSAQSSAAGPSPPSNLIYLEQPYELTIDKTCVPDEPRKLASWHVTLMATNKKRDRSTILVAHDNMAACLMVYILTSLPKDFKQPSSTQ
jgi:hypothetical protein